MPRFTKGRPGLHVDSEILLLLTVVSLICGTGPHVNETWCVISSAKCELVALGRGAALVIDLYFFNGVLFSFEARLTGTVCRENINYYTTTPTLVLVSKKIYRLELQCLLAKGCPLASHTITLSPDLKRRPLSPSSPMVIDPPGKKSMCTVDALVIGERGHTLTTRSSSQT